MMTVGTNRRGAVTLKDVPSLLTPNEAAELVYWLNRKLVEASKQLYKEHA